MDGDRADRAPLDAVALGARLREVVGAAARVEVVARSGSTSTALADALRTTPDAWPERSVLLADHQDAGRGRRGRTWSTPPGTAVTVSVVLPLPPREEHWGWLTLVGGLAVTDAVRDLTGVAAGLKWPNDVVVPGGADDVPGWGGVRKVAGVLGEVVPTARGPVAVVGIGVNVAQRADELPVRWATSLALAAPGGAPGREDVAVAVVRALVALDDAWRAAGGDPAAAGLAGRCRDLCVTLGRPVRVDLPGDRVLEGTARSLGADGALEVVDTTGRVHAVLAGDVRHVRASR